MVLVTRPNLLEFREGARAWLEQQVPRRSDLDVETAWGQGSDSVAIFRDFTSAEEMELINNHRQWVQRKADAGFANVSWAPRWGGRGLSLVYDRVFAEEESKFAIPPFHEAIGITVGLVAPTIRAFGNDEQRERFLRRMLRTEDLWCQLFSEPGGGSDLAGATTKAERDGDAWVLNGQKVWTSGARYADWGYAICRTDSAVPKHRGLTAFVVPMDTPGVEVRPLRQITGGSSFNEVFFSDVRIPDANRLGDAGAGWRVALTTLGFERSARIDDNGRRRVQRLISLAHHLGRQDDAPIRQLVARAFSRQRLLDLTSQRAEARARNADQTPGPEGSIDKLYRTETMRVFNEAASALLGLRLVANTGEWGTFAWAEHVVGTAGARIAGGTDEIQRNILGERILGLPREPRLDRDIPFQQVPR
jgi:alkylation response protein AidB-like acyl-CoA dehydrogenase